MPEFRAQDNELQPLSAQLDTVEREAGEDETESSEPSIDQAKWSRSPRKLTNNARSSPFSTSLDAILACFPIIFLVLAILAIRLDGTQVSQYGDGIIQATQLLPSIFPIVFAAIVGGLMRNFALWRAENCAPLGVLEQLNGSTSFAGTVSSILALRQATLLSISVLLLWAMSPIGGQSALRMVSQAASSVSGNASAAYINMNGSSSLIGFSAMTAGLTVTNAVYTASLLASREVKDSPRDLWGWPKIPLLRTLPPVSSSSNSTNPWRTPVSNDSIIYSSLAGIVLQGIPRDLDAEFSVESSYLDLDCHLVANDSTERELYEIMGESVLAHNATNLFKHPTYYGNSEVAMSNFFIDTTYNFAAPPPEEGWADFNSTFCTTSRAIRVYRTNFGWVSVFIFGVILLQFCAVAALFLKSMTIAPDILGYVSSMTRENTHTPLPAGGSSYSGPERARLLRDLKVQILDVQCYDDTGHIALASSVPVGMMGQKLNRRREYG